MSWSTASVGVHSSESAAVIKCHDIKPEHHKLAACRDGEAPTRHRSVRQGASCFLPLFNTHLTHTLTHSEQALASCIMFAIISAIAFFTALIIAAVLVFVSVFTVRMRAIGVRCKIYSRTHRCKAIQCNNACM
jgi:hypothetical protein